MSMSGDDHMSKTAPISARRIEVFTGAGRRREWDPAQKASIIAESYVGDVSVCDVARRHGLTPSQLFTWRRDARRRLGSTKEVRDDLFVPAIVDDGLSALTVAGSAEVAGKPAPVLELEIGGSSVWVWHEAEIDLVTAVVRALKSGR